MKRFDDLVEPRPFSQAWDIEIKSNAGTVTRNTKGELELRNYMSWLNMQNINLIAISKGSSMTDVDQLSMKCSYYQLLLILFDQTVDYHYFSCN